jgi:hypothetical protein
MGYHELRRRSSPLLGVTRYGRIKRGRRRQGLYRRQVVIEVAWRDGHGLLAFLVDHRRRRYTQQTSGDARERAVSRPRGSVSRPACCAHALSRVRRVRGRVTSRERRRPVLDSLPRHCELRPAPIPGRYAVRTDRWCTPLKASRIC